MQKFVKSRERMHPDDHEPVMARRRRAGKRDTNGLTGSGALPTFRL